MRQIRLGKENVDNMERYILLEESSCRMSCMHQGKYILFLQIKDNMERSIEIGGGASPYFAIA